MEASLPFVCRKTCFCRVTSVEVLNPFQQLGCVRVRGSTLGDSGARDAIGDQGKS